MDNKFLVGYWNPVSYNPFVGIFSIRMVVVVEILSAMTLSTMIFVKIAVATLFLLVA